MNAIFQRIARSRIIAVVRCADAATALEIGHALIDEGVDVLEVSLTTPDALAVISALRQRPQACVGAGTVLSEQQVLQTEAAGAQFIVAPNTDPDVIAAARRRDLVMAAGVFTGTECALALRAGADLLKLFPAMAAGIGTLRAFQGPFPSARWLPTGGIDLTNARDWLAAGATALGVGGSLTGAGVEAARVTARDFVAAVQQTDGSQRDEN